MKISLRDNSLVLTFQYDSRVVQAVKNLPGRTYSPRHKCWIVPMDHVQQVIDTLVPLGFVADPAIFSIQEAEKVKRESLQAIRSNPSSYAGKLPLYDFQRIGAMFMRASEGTLLADVPGLGKTIQTIAALETETGPFLVLCPASLKYSWLAEIKKWEPGASTVVIEGKPSEREYKWKYAKFGNPTSRRLPVKYTIANYELLLRDLDLIAAVPWSAIVCDEATRISNPRAKSVKALKQVGTKKRLALTGTPVSNTPVDLWSIVDWLRKGYLGTFPQFKDKYVVEDWHGGVAGYVNLDDLSNRIAPLMLRRTKEEVFKDFPPKTIEDIKFDLSPEESKVYEGVKKLLLEEISSYLTKIDWRTMGIIPVKMLRLKQVTDHLHLVGEKGESSKLQALKDILEPIIKSGEKVIVFTQFATMADILIQELGAYLIKGEVDPETRQKIVEEFNSSESKYQILVSTEAGAYGLNIQSSSYIIHYDLCWSVAKLEQREGRAHRIGQKKNVTVYRLIAKNSIDEYVAEVLLKKQKISNQIIDDDNSAISEEDVHKILGG